MMGHAIVMSLVAAPTIHVTTVRRAFALLGVLACLLTVPPRSAAQPLVVGDFVRAAWGARQGLPANAVYAILQTRDGYLWLGTSGGLVRFDGAAFTSFDPISGSGPVGTRIFALAEDANHDVWIGTEAGLTRYRDGRFTTLTATDGIPSAPVTSLLPTRDGRLLVGTRSGLVAGRGQRFEPVVLPADVAGAEVRALVEDAGGRIWIGTTRGLIRAGTGEPPQRFGTSHGLPFDEVIALLADRTGVLWIGTTRGLARWQNGRITADGLAALAGRSIDALLEDRHGTVWIGTRGIFTWRQGTIVPFDTGLPPEAGAMHTVIEDREGDVWIGTEVDGALRFRPRRVRFYPPPSGQSLMAITGDGEGGVWVGGLCSGLFRVRDGTFSAIDLGPQIEPPCVRALLRDPDGTLWAGASGGRLFQRRDGRLTQLSTGRRAAINAMHRARDGQLWIGTQDGAGRFDERTGRITFTARADGLVHDDVRFITEDAEGALWFATMGGASRFKDGRFSNYTTANGLSHDTVRAILADADGTIWIGTYGGGLNRLKDGRFTHYSTINGLFDNIVSRILDDGAGNLWMSGNKGVQRVARRDLDDVAAGRARAVRSAAYNESDGMTVSETNGGGQPAGWRTADGRLWFPTVKGLAVIEPRLTNMLPPVAMVERVFANGLPVDLSSPLRLAAGQRDLEFRYTAPSFGDAAKVRFRYKLEGHDADWQDAGARRAAYYTNLAPGAHRFLVSAINEDLVPSAQPGALAFTIAPRFHERPVFYVLAAVLLAGAAAGGHRWRLARLVARTRDLEQRVATRTAEVVEQKDHLAELNFELGQANEDLRSVLNELRLGVVMTGADGVVTFVSQTARRLLGGDADHAVGRRWDEALGLTAAGRDDIRNALALPRERRPRLPMEIARASGERYAMEVDLKDNPRESGGHLFFLYDLTEIYDLRRKLAAHGQLRGLVGETAPMQLVFKQIRDVARVETTVLVEGETGTGKELVARAIHDLSPRARKPFVAVNTAGLAESLLASQLFGHRRGAFTGAVADQPGVFEAADGGTIFLDEIGDVPPLVQMHLLRVLQEREITRLGDSHPRKIDVRVIVATHRNLAAEVADGRFRQDLLYRIRVARVQLPPLRERRADIPLLVSRFLAEAGEASGKPVRDVSRGAMDLLLDHTWPGNVRELKAAIDSAVIACAGSVLQPGDLPPEVTAGRAADRGESTDMPLAADGSLTREAIVAALHRARGNRARAARLLGIGRTTLYRRLKALDLDTADE